MKGNRYALKLDETSGGLRLYSRSTDRPEGNILTISGIVAEYRNRKVKKEDELVADVTDETHTFSTSSVRQSSYGSTGSRQSGFGFSSEPVPVSPPTRRSGMSSRYDKETVLLAAVKECNTYDNCGECSYRNVFCDGYTSIGPDIRHSLDSPGLIRSLENKGLLSS